MTRTAASAGAKSAAGADQGGLEWGLEGRRPATKGGAFFALSLPAAALLLGLLGGACRPHLSVCDGDCDERPAPPASGGGGAGAESADGGETANGAAPSSAGAAGAPTNACREDRDCDDGVFCNGAERCREAVCVAGAQLACEDGTACQERATEGACVYAEPSPWLVLLTNRQIVGLPTTQIGRRPLLTLGERPSDDLFIGFNDVAFSPDGAHALIDYMVPDFGQQVLELAFDEGIPKPVERVKNLPNWGSYSVPVFSRGGERALLFEGGTGPYLLDLTGPAAVPSSLALPASYGWDTKFCRSHDAWVMGSSPATFYSLASGELVSTEVGGQVVAVSPDGERAWLRGESSRIVSCGAEPELGPTGLPDAGGSWSPDSRWLLATLDDGSAKLFSVSSSLETTEVWSTEALGASVWSPDGGALLVRVDDDETSRFAFLDLEAEAPVERALALPADASIDRCSDDGCLVLVPRAEQGFDLIWQPFSTNTAAAVLATELGSEDAVEWADFAQRRLVLRRFTATGSELTLADFEGSPEQALFTWSDGSLESTPASDGSGLLLQLSDDYGYSNFWLPFAGSNAASAVVPLDVPAYRIAFQPWARQAP